MERKTVLTIMIALLLIGSMALEFNTTRINGSRTAKLVGAPDTSVTENVDSWPMFHHDLNHSGYSTSRAPNTNQTAWIMYTTAHHLYYGVASSPAVADGTVFVGSWDNNVYALNETTGTQMWNYTTGDLVDSSPAVADGIVYIGSYDFNVYALNATTGTQIWNYTTGDELVLTSPAVAGGIVYVGSFWYDAHVYALNATTGTQIWNYTVGGAVVPSPAVTGGVVYVGSGDGHVYALDATTGTQIWNYTTGGTVRSSPAVIGGIVYVGSDDGHVYALDATTGTQIWNYTTGSNMLSSPAVDGGIVYIGSDDGHVYALDATTGTQIWNYTTGGGVWSSPAVADGKVYVGSLDNNVYALNASTGALVWSYTTGGGVFSSPAVSGGRVCVGSLDGNVYAFGVVHDIAVTGMTGQTVTGQNMTNVIQVTVVNLGNSTETFNLTAYYNGTAILNERWLPDTPSVAFYGMGDADRDGYIDGWDIDMIRQAFGWTGPPGQNPADINLDGKVLGDDMITCAKNYGKDIWTVLGLPRLIEDHEVVVLQPGFWAIMAFRWNTTGLSKGNYTLSVYAWPVQGETSTADNNYTFGTVRVAMVGDVNGDGKVEGKDLGWVAWCFGSYPGSPTIYWNPNCDINSDGKVDGKDLGVPASLFGQADP